MNTSMTLSEIYRLAITENITAKEAGEKYGCNPWSLQKIKGKHGFPSLKSSYDKVAEERITGLNDTQLKSYYKALLLPTNVGRCKAETKCAEREIKNRNL